MTTSSDLVIRDLEKTSSTILTAVGREALASLLASEGRMVPGEAVTAKGADGAEMTAKDWFVAKLATFPAFVEPKTKDAPVAPSGNMTERAIATIAAARSDKTTKAREIHENFGNPWMSSRLNRTHQSIIRNSDPVLADKLQAEAAL